MIAAAFSGVIRASFSSKSLAVAALSSWSETRALRAIAVLMPPGWTAVTPTLWPAISISSRIASVMPRTAYFDALYMLWPGIETRPKSEEMLTRCPSPDSIRCGQEELRAVHDAPEVDAR